MTNICTVGDSRMGLHENSTATTKLNFVDSFWNCRQGSMLRAVSSTRGPGGQSPAVKKRAAG